MVVCNSCEKLLAMGDIKLEFELDGIKAVLCDKCYIELPKEKKKKLIYIGKKASLINWGLTLGLAGAAGWQEAQIKSIVNEFKRYDLNIIDIDFYTIDKFNTHFWLCKEKEQNQTLQIFKENIKKEKINELSLDLFNKTYENCLEVEKQQIEKRFDEYLRNNKKNNKEINF